MTAVVASEVSKIGDAPDARDNHNDSSSSIEAEAEQNVSNQTVILAANDSIKSATEVEVNKKYFFLNIIL